MRVDAKSSFFADAWDAGDASLASGRNADGSDAGSVFADVRGGKFWSSPTSSISSPVV